LARRSALKRTAGLEKRPLWHERDISHPRPSASSFRLDTLADYLLNKTATLIETMFVYPDRMLTNLRSTRGLVSVVIAARSGRSGVSREDAYRLVQSHPMHA